MKTVVKGHRINLRPVQPDDAGYIYGLRMNPAYNTHLSQVSGTADDQRRWIEAYKAREAAGQEFYLIIERTDGRPCGTVRLYDITADSFTWGSWILDHNKPAKASLESSVMSFGVGFDGLNRTKAQIEVRRLNTHAAAFYRRFGAVEIGQDAETLYFELPRDIYLSNLAHFRKIIEADA